MFKPGNRVICIRDNEQEDWPNSRNKYKVIKGQIYTVTSCSDRVTLEECGDSLYYPNRFKLVKQKVNTPTEEI